ncbi:Uncharacterized protein FWK35_00018578 [Aphis craccivora]|uniref:Uncharacterized protein n=1 Tax=Aphis craccivora TaxID=307492 RepID=A0A6G0YTE8_APHCR|nr:Uncharacterized protein FWK35_00018578 [Aphis craccivora]
MNLVVFKSAGKNQKKKKMKEKREFLRKTSFRPNRFFYMLVIQKLIIVPYEWFLFVYNSKFYEICRKRENLQLKNHTFFCKNNIYKKILPTTEIFILIIYYPIDTTLRQNKFKIWSSSINCVHILIVVGVEEILAV